MRIERASGESQASARARSHPTLLKMESEFCKKFMNYVVLSSSSSLSRTTSTRSDNKLKHVYLYSRRVASNVCVCVRRIVDRNERIKNEENDDEYDEEKAENRRYTKYVHGTSFSLFMFSKEFIHFYIQSESILFTIHIINTAAAASAIRWACCCFSIRITYIQKNKAQNHRMKNVFYSISLMFLVSLGSFFWLLLTYTCFWQLFAYWSNKMNKLHRIEYMGRMQCKRWTVNTAIGCANSSLTCLGIEVRRCVHQRQQPAPNMWTPHNTHPTIWIVAKQWSNNIIISEEFRHTRTHTHTRGRLLARAEWVWRKENSFIKMLLILTIIFNNSQRHVMRAWARAALSREQARV